MAVFKGFHITDIGSREENQDSLIMLQKPGENGNYILLAAIADGAGGCQEGKIASTSLLSAITKWFQETPSDILEEKRGKLMNALDAALKEIHENMKEYARKKGITFGTTLTLIIITNENRYIAAQVGDSRLYIFQEDSLVQITKDQTVAQREKDTGEEMKCSSEKNSTLLQCIGAGKVSPKYYDGTLAGKSQIFLCSDGQTNRISQDEIKEVLETDKAGDEKISILVRLARNKMEQDNITTILITKEETWN